MLGLGRANLQDGEVELVEIVGRFLFYRGGEMLLDIGVVSFGAGEPAGHDVVGGAVAIGRINVVERAADCVHLAEAQGRGSEVELGIQIMRKQARDLGAPGHGFGFVLSLADVGQNLKRRQRIGPDAKNLMGRVGRAGEILILQMAGGALQQTRFAPAAVGMRRVGEKCETESEASHDRDGKDQISSGKNRGTSIVVPPLAPHPSDLRWHVPVHLSARRITR